MPHLSRDELRSRRAVRRHTDRRRSHRVLVTVVAPAVLVAAIIAAVVLAARGGPTDQPAGSVASPVPSSAMVGAPAPTRVVLARAGRLEVALPIAERQVTAVLFHPVSDPGAIAMTPSQGLPHRVASDDGRTGPQTAAVDVGAPAGSTVYSPVDGVVTGVTPYRVFGRPEGLEIILTPSGLPDVAVRVAHVEPAPDGIVPRVGSAVGAGHTVIGRVRDLSRVERQEIAQFTNDSGNHVSIELLRQTTGPGA